MLECAWSCGNSKLLLGFRIVRIKIITTVVDIYSIDSGSGVTSYQGSISTQATTMAFGDENTIYVGKSD